MDISQGIKKRASIRAYLTKAVPDDLIKTILDAARSAPSWVNTQPWQVAVLKGEIKESIGRAYLKERLGGAPARPDFAYKPSKWGEPYKSRRRACRSALFSAIGVKDQDREKRLESCMAGYSFFGAPLGLLFFMDRGLGVASLLDIGMFMQNVALAAMDHGLGTCALAALAEYPDLARAALGLPESSALACGMALGYPNPDAPVNHVRAARAKLDDFTTWYEKI